MDGEIRLIRQGEGYWSCLLFLAKRAQFPICYVYFLKLLIPYFLFPVVSIGRNRLDIQRCSKFEMWYDNKNDLRIEQDVFFTLIYRMRVPTLSGRKVWKMKMTAYRTFPSLTFLALQMVVEEKPVYKFRLKSLSGQIQAMIRNSSSEKKDLVLCKYQYPQKYILLISPVSFL